MSVGARGKHLEEFKLMSNTTIEKSIRVSQMKASVSAY
jgi:hypothetical protein